MENEKRSEEESKERVKLFLKDFKEELIRELRLEEAQRIQHRARLLEDLKNRKN